jgi:hypothetical protein
MFMRMALFAWDRPASHRPASRLRLAVSAIAISIVLGAPRSRALDLDGVDGLNTDTIASRERLRVWDNIKKYGAEAVNERDRIYVKPEGVRMGNYLVFPEAGATVVFDDNIFTRDFEKRSDWRSELNGGIKFQSQLPRHVLDFSLDGKVVSYAENSDQDYANFRARADGALHFDHAHTLSASVLSAIEHEERDDPTYPLAPDGTPLLTLSTAARGPIEVHHNRAAVGITRDVGRLYGTLSSTIESWDFQDTVRVDGSHLEQDLRDTTVYSSQVKFGYRFSPGYTFVGKVRGLRDENKGNFALDRDAWGFEAMAGLAFETNPLLRWRILGGYGVRDFEKAGLATLTTTLMEGDVQWLPTQRLTVYGNVVRQILEAADAISSGVVQTSAKLRAEYEIYHNLVMSGAIEVRQDDFQGIARQDDIYAVRAGLDYYYTKNWLFTFGYEHQVRDSSDDSLDMHRNRFMFGAKLRF